MFDMNCELNKFYRDHVRLNKEQRGKLAEYRETNIARLKCGLDKLGYSHPSRIRNQGSFAMFTTNQHPNNDYDIDVAIVFEKDDSPESPLDSRNRIESAMKEGGGNFSRPPEARTNAVTVWYQEGHHVDLAVHRRYLDQVGLEVIEHAGVEWKPRDPMEITNWFNNLVNELSPSKTNGATVSDEQMRRIVQLLKMFAKSRESWKLPGGLIISTLVAEVYLNARDYHRDDVALYNTLNSISNRLQLSTDVYNPVDGTQKLTYKDEYINQVERLKDQLEKAKEWLQPLFASSCTTEKAIKAWKQFFNHSYWSELLDEIIENAKARGEEIQKAASTSSLYITKNAQLSITKSTERHLEVPYHRNFGDVEKHEKKKE